MPNQTCARAAALWWVTDVSKCIATRFAAAMEADAMVVVLFKYIFLWSNVLFNLEASISSSWTFWAFTWGLGPNGHFRILIFALVIVLNAQIWFLFFFLSKLVLFSELKAFYPLLPFQPSSVSKLATSTRSGGHFLLSSQYSVLTVAWTWISKLAQVIVTWWAFVALAD